MILEFQLDRPKILWRQVADQLRDKIVRGELAPGTKLPSTTQLASQTGTNVNTIHQALSDLVRAGLVTRARKVGTYVAQRKPHLTSLGIYHAYDVESASYGSYLEKLTRELRIQAHALDIETRIWTDPRPRQEQQEILPSLEKATRERKIGGLITTLSDPRHTSWLKKVSVPVAYLGDNNLPSGVTLDDTQLITSSLECLKRQGSHSAGIIVPFYPSYVDFFRNFQIGCDALGLVTRPEWILSAQGEETFLDPLHEQFGYQAFHQLWDQNERPDGLVIYPDGVVRGALLALMARQVRVPEDLKLVLHQNEGIPLLCPVPAAFAITHISKIAAALLRQVDALFQGKCPQTIVVEFEIIPPVGTAP